MGPILLASGSAARAGLLRAAGLAFEAQAVAVDEEAIRQGMRAEGATAEETALELAETKALRARKAAGLVIGADQILVCGDRWFDKPPDVAAARQHLQALRGQRHQLVTAVVCVRDGRVVWHHVATPRLVMRAFSDAFLEAYLAREGADLLQSVGAYRLEGPGVQLFEAIEGEHAAILGLPMLPLLGFLRQHGVLTA